MSLNIWLTESSGKKVFTQRMVVVSNSSHPMHDYAGNKSLMKSVFAEAFDNLEVQFAVILNSKLDR